MAYKNKILALLALAGMLAGVLARAQAHPADASVHQEFLKRLVAAAIERTHHVVRYDPAYVKIPYPGGDVPADTGVCADEVIRPLPRGRVDLRKKSTKT